MKKEFLFLILILLINLIKTDELNIEEEFNKKWILENNGKIFDKNQKNFPNEVLVFLTPWNKDGFKYVEQYIEKIDFVSPVWFNMKSITIGKSNKKILLEGEHNIDKEYIQTLKYLKKEIKIVPRIYWPGDDEGLLEAIVEQETMEQFINSMITLLEKYGFDGFVLDSPLTSYTSTLGEGFMAIYELISEIIHSHNKLLILTLMGSNQQLKRKNSDIKRILNICDKLLVCTYDYQTDNNHFAISPIEWVRENVEYFLNDLDISFVFISKKILMGIPFYGTKITNKGRNTIIAKDYLELLEKNTVEIKWNEEYKECETKNTNFKAFYPCLNFIKERLNFFEETSVGAFIWDGGQGFQYFYELF